MNQYINLINDTNFPIMKEGDYRVRINRVSITLGSDYNAHFEIILDVSGTARKLTYYVCLDMNNEQETNNRLQALYNSFGINYSEQDNLDSWKRKTGAVRIINKQYQGKTFAKIAFCLDKEYQKKLPKWKEVNFVNRK